MFQARTHPRCTRHSAAAPVLSKRHPTFVLLEKPPRHDLQDSQRALPESHLQAAIQKHLSAQCSRHLHDTLAGLWDRCVLLAAATVGAVYDRPRDRPRAPVGGHFLRLRALALALRRPPLQRYHRWSEPVRPQKTSVTALPRSPTPPAPVHIGQGTDYVSRPRLRFPSRHTTSRLRRCGRRCRHKRARRGMVVTSWRTSDRTSRRRTIRREAQLVSRKCN